uniref:Uncharacterized protein n=1 Tax=Anguilla anguilla TaxID=7936 RepID=A0A0E9RQ40_ANGAN
MMIHALQHAGNVKNNLALFSFNVVMPIDHNILVFCSN